MLRILVDGDTSLPPNHAHSPLPLQHPRQCSVYWRPALAVVSWDTWDNKGAGNRLDDRGRLTDWSSSFSQSTVARLILRHTQFQSSWNPWLSSREYREWPTQSPQPVLCSIWTLDAETPWELYRRLFRSSNSSLITDTDLKGYWEVTAGVFSFTVYVLFWFSISSRVPIRTPLPGKIPFFI